MMMNISIPMLVISWRTPRLLREDDWLRLVLIKVVGGLKLDEGENWNDQVP